MAEQTVNIPQIIAVLLVAFLVVRWYFSPGNNRSGRAPRPVNPAHVESVHQMFPQLDRRTIAWDLHRNGGNVQATTEVVLSGRTLAQPPPSFQPAIAISNGSQAPRTSSRGADKKPPLPDLITRYNLASKVTSSSDDGSTASEASSTSRSSGWSQNKVERSELLKKRREDMVLAARRKMEERDRQAGKA